MNKTRLEALSDGVIAIIITIMVLEFKVPHSGEWEALRPLIPTFISYLLSFAYIGIYWNNHHHMMHPVKHISGGIMWSNLNLLFWLSLVPFATAWMGENHFAAATVAVYSFLLIMSGLAYDILRRFIKDIFSTVSYGIAIIFSFFYPVVSMVLIAVVAMVWFIPDPNIEKNARD
jgi:uncharacterized membrane protein